MSVPAKITATLLGIGMAAPATTPAMADGAERANDSNFGDGVNAAHNWNFTTSAVCLQEVAVVPVLGDSTRSEGAGQRAHRVAARQKARKGLDPLTWWCRPHNVTVPVLTVVSALGRGVGARRAPCSHITP